MDDTALLSAQDGPVLTLTLNRPERLNSLTPALLDLLAAELASARGDATVRALVITGAGRGFCSGADLRSEGPLDVRKVLADHYAPVIRLMREIEKPIVGCVNGVAAGAGMSLALACDLRVAAASASFIQAFVRIGLVPDAGGTFFLPRLVGPARAMEMALLGDRVEAAEALAMGLVNRVVPDSEARDAAHALAGRLAAGPRSVGLIKRALNLSMSSDLDTQMRHEEELQALAAASSDFVEGVLAFQEGRPPRFTGH